MTKIYSVYITCATTEEAGEIAKAIVEERLAACVNILGEVASVYRWEGRVEQAAEVALLAKTTATQLPTLTARVEALHSYNVPCITAWEVQGGSAGYLDWVRGEAS